MKNNTLKYTCLFGGGAIRGAAHVGAIKAMEEIGVEICTLGGSSVGSIVAALVAVGYSANEIKEIFMGVNFDLFKDLQFGLGPRFALSKGEVFLDWMRELIEKKYYGNRYKKGKNKAVTFKDIDKKLVIITTDISNFACKEFSKFETPDFEIATAVRISSSMPGLMKPYEYNNLLLVDGDLQKSMPMWMLSPNLLNKDERVLELRLEGEFYGSDKNAIDYINTVYTCITSMSTNYLKEMYSNKDKFDYITLNTGDVIIVDFNCSEEKREELIASGYKQTIDYFKKVLPKKKSKLLEDYKSINKYLKRVKKYIDNNKIVKAKVSICELFVGLCEYKDIIDSDITNSIKNFNQVFAENITYPALFGQVGLKDKDKIIENLTNIIETTTSKIEELENYISKYKN